MDEHDGIIDWCKSLGVTCENPYDHDVAWLWEDWEDECSSRILGCVMYMIYGITDCPSCLYAQATCDGQRERVYLCSHGLLSIISRESQERLWMGNFSYYCTSLW